MKNNKLMWVEEEGIRLSQSNPNYCIHYHSMNNIWRLYKYNSSTPFLMEGTLKDCKTFANNDYQNLTK